MVRSSEIAYDAIRRSIVSGEFAQGTWLREEDLAERIGVSRTPVREALNKLAAEGFAELLPNRGAKVSSWSKRDAEEIFSLRALLEPHACHLAAGTIDGGALIHLDDLARRMSEQQGRGMEGLDAIAELNNEFHETVIGACDNKRLSAVMANLVQVSLVHRTFHHYSEEALSRSLAHHHEIVQALRVGDGEWAESVMRSHVLSGFHAIEAYLPNGPEPETDS